MKPLLNLTRLPKRVNRKGVANISSDDKEVIATKRYIYIFTDGVQYKIDNPHPECIVSTKNFVGSLYYLKSETWMKL